MLGRAFSELFDSRKISYRGTHLESLDITNVTQVETAIDENTTAVVNCSAYTDVDGAEVNEDLALQVNGFGVENLASRCASVGATLVHFSTDYVFNGRATAPYPTDAKHAPINAYGRTKAAGEQAIWDSECSHLLIRTSWLYAPWANNFVRTMARLTKDKDTLSVVDDQRGRPTSAQYLARRTLALLESGERGTFHVTDGDECTWNGFTVEIARQLSHRCEVSPCSSDAFPRPATRPPYSVLSLEKTDAAIGPSKRWQDNLAEVLSQLEPE